jgi:threonine aldolase
MLNFASDYTEGAHEKILKRIAETNLEQNPGYGTDRYCESAKDRIRKACGCPEAQVTFLTGGTQTNQIVIDTMLKPYEGVVAADTGHVNVHEAGAIEYTGHKVMTLPAHDGRIDSRELETFLNDSESDGNREHMVFPGMVYISHPTEYGTLYSLKELKSISDICRRHNIPLFMDGARLGYGLMSDGTDVDLASIAGLTDVFYIGGTKVGALFGEAVVFTKKNMPDHFVTRTKQHGALLAKGWLLGIQFDTLFTDDLYFRISRNAILMAEMLRSGLKEKGYAFLLDSPTNQQFVILDNSRMDGLSKKVTFSIWEKVDETHTAVRFATSWATTEESVRELLDMM